MKISIAMATYNGAKYLPEQLQSFVDQSRLPDELVVTDDGSSDETMAILEEFSATAPFEVRYYQNKSTLGYAGNFNHAISRTSGELIFLSDQDDVWFPEKLKRIEGAAKKYPGMLVFMNDAVLTDAQLNPIGLTKLGQIRSGGFPDSSFVMGCCVALRREFADLVMPISVDYPSHDSWLVRIADGMERRRVVDEGLQYYRRHGDNESQFLANRTSRLTKIDVLKHRISILFRSSENDDVGEALAAEKLFVEGVVRAANRSRDAAVKDALTRYGNELQDRVKAIEGRYAIRKRARILRLPAVVRLWRKGGYAHFHGLKSAARDMFFN